MKGGREEAKEGDDEAVDDGEAGDAIKMVMEVNGNWGWGCREV